MVTDRSTKKTTGIAWDPDWIERSEMFAPLRAAANGLRRPQWPDVGLINRVVEARQRPVVNAQGKRIRFVPQSARPVRFEERFEPRAYLRGEVLMREDNWHDLFNALVWLTFPCSKAAINARHYASLKAQAGTLRSPEGDALTLFDEDGAVVLSADADLFQLLLQHRWTELFVTRRDEVRAKMRFVIFGHAMYEKALDPFIGMTAKCVLLPFPSEVLEWNADAMWAEIDRRLAMFIRDRSSLGHGRSLTPLPVLGVPGWWRANENEAFYGNARYFRSRSEDALSGSGLSSMS